MPNNTQNNIPNSNNLFEIFKSNIKTIEEIQDIVIKGKVNKKTVKVIKDSADILLQSADIMYNALNEIAKKDLSITDQSMNSIKQLTGAIHGIYLMIDEIAKLRTLRLIHSITITGLLTLFMAQLNEFLVVASRVPKSTIENDSITISSIGALMIRMAEVVDALATINFVKYRQARRGVERLNEVLFGSKKHPGIMDVMKSIGKPNYNKSILIGVVALGLLMDAIKKIGKVLFFLGFLLPIIALSKIAISIINVVIKGLIRTFTFASKHMGRITKGSLALYLISNSIALFVINLVLMGAIVMLGYKIAGISILMVMAVIGLMALLGLASKIIRKGIRVIKHMAYAVMLISMTALLLALLGQFVTVNFGGFLMVVAYMVAIVGLFLLLSVVGKPIKHGSRNLIAMSLGILLISMVAVLISFVGALIVSNMWAFIAITGMIVGLILLFRLLGDSHSKIMKGLPAAIIIVFGTVYMAMAIGILAVIAMTTNIARLSIVTGLMIGIMLSIFGLMIVLATMASTGVGALALGIGVIIMLAIAGTILMMCIVIKSIAEAVGLIDKHNIQDDKRLAKKIKAPIHIALSVMGALATINPILLIIASHNARLLARSMGSIGTIAVILSNIASLSIPDPEAGYDKNGKPLGWKKMSGQDFADAMQNANGIFAVAAGMFDEKMNGKTIKFADGSTAVINVVSMDGIKNISRRTKRKVKQLSKIVGYVGDMATILQRIASMKMPDPEAGYDENGKPLKWKQVTGKDFSDAAINAGSIFTFFANIFADEPNTMIFAGKQVKVTPINMATLDNISRSTKRKVARLGRIISVVGGMAETIRNISSLRVPDASGPDDFNENGTPKKWRLMTPYDISNAAVTSSSMLAFFCALFGEKTQTLSFGSLGNVVVNPISEDALNNITRSTKRKIESIGAIIAVVGGMGETLQNLAGCIVPDIQSSADINENGTPKKWRKMSQQDFDNAMGMAEKILTSIVNILGDEGMHSRLSSMSKRNLEKLGVAMDAIKGLDNIMELVKALAGGRMATKWEMDNNPKSPTYGQEKPVEYINIVEYINKHNNDITNTVRELILCPISAMSQITNDKASMNMVKQAVDGCDLIVGVIDKIRQPITDVIDLYNNKLSKADVKSIKPAFEGVIIGIIGPFEEINTDKMMATQKSTLVVFERIVASMSKLKIDDNTAKNFQNNVKETIALLKTVDVVNIDKLKVADSLMKHIAYLSKSINGNFKALAEAINEDLLSALEKLTKALDAVNSKEFNTPVSAPVSAGKVLAPSGSAGVKNKQQQAQPVQKENKNQLTKTDIKMLRDSIESIRHILDKAVDVNGRFNVKMN